MSDVSLRPDLHGTVLDLPHTEVWSLIPGQRLRLRVEHVAAGDERGWSPVRGWPLDGDGKTTSDPASVLVRDTALPPPEADS